MTNNISADRLSFDSISDVHDVGYDSMGNAYCRKIDTHHWKTGDEHWVRRSQKGYITFGDKHLGGAVQHKVEVLPGEGYVAFWTRMKRAENSGNIDVMGTSCYSAKDAAILAKEIGEKPDRKFIDQNALVGMTTAEGDAWRDEQNSSGKATATGGSGGGIAGLSIGVIALALVAIYMFMRRKK